VFIQAGRIFMQ